MGWGDVNSGNILGLGTGYRFDRYMYNAFLGAVYERFLFIAGTPTDDVTDHEITTDLILRTDLDTKLLFLDSKLKQLVSAVTWIKKEGFDDVSTLGYTDRVASNPFLNVNITFLDTNVFTPANLSAFVGAQYYDAVYINPKFNHDYFIGFYKILSALRYYRTNTSSDDGRNPLRGTLTPTYYSDIIRNAVIAPVFGVYDLITTPSYTYAPPDKVQHNPADFGLSLETNKANSESGAESVVSHLDSGPVNFTYRHIIRGVLYGGASAHVSIYGVGANNDWDHVFYDLAPKEPHMDEYRQSGNADVFIAREEIKTGPTDVPAGYTLNYKTLMSAPINYATKRESQLVRIFPPLIGGIGEGYEYTFTETTVSSDRPFPSFPEKNPTEQASFQNGHYTQMGNDLLIAYEDSYYNAETPSVVRPPVPAWEDSPDYPSGVSGNSSESEIIQYGHIYMTGIVIEYPFDNSGLGFPTSYPV